jgi:hypothetical protein
MPRTLQQILDAGGADPALFSVAAQLIGLGTMFTQQHRALTFTTAATIRLSDIDPSIPGVRAGGIFSAASGEDGIGPMLAIPAPASLVPNGTTGLTIGSSNGAVRIQAKDGYTIRYLQFGGGGNLTNGPTYSRASQALKVFSTGSGYVIEVWVQLATSASAVATSTAAQVQAAILADANAMRGIAVVDLAGGSGASAAFDMIGLNASYGMYPATLAAAGGSNPQSLSPGTAIVSRDGNLIGLPQAVAALTMDYFPAPRMPLEEPYPGSL